MKYTKGPWKVVVDNLVRDTHGVCIHGDSSFIHNIHNAILISAAPEMLDALKNLMREIQFNGPTIKRGCLGDKHPYQEALNAAVRVINKAEGITELEVK